MGKPQPSAQRIFPKSALVYTLTETLHDAAALAYFIQFMEGIGQLNLIKFWLHAESFRCSALAAKKNDGALIAMIKNDAVRIYSKYIAEDASCSINITDHLRKIIQKRINVKNGFFDPCCFSEAQSFVLNIMESRYFKEFENSIYYAKHRIDVISSGALTMQDIMLCQPLLCAFVEYMENEDGGKLVEFIISAESFAEQLPLTQSDEQAIEDAMIIYNRYFSMQATEPLKFDAKTRIQIESDICLGNGRPAPSCFETARLMALHILEQISE
ncbi:unnamed protein product [Onchocerca flexuosa]|uniref:RGS domain-containing protein n=1 Tax=Onchocerca flexuosa TaxID=387005 RepID=A0A183H3U5_9BILA|nr:unnamed protein product [Onchocerca flexuosa]